MSALAAKSTNLDILTQAAMLTYVDNSSSSQVDL